MPEAREIPSIIEAAERAASDGDFVTAELSLREAAALQEAQFGPFHADLANTLNNLGVIYERVDSPAEAELCYRRAYAIATKALAPDHAFVATTRKNLEDFCKARGRPFERSSVPRERVATRKPASRPFRPMVITVVSALGFAMLAVGALWFRSSEQEASSAVRPTQTLAQPQTPTPGAVPAEQKGGPQESPGAESTALASRNSVRRESGTPVASTPITVRITEAQLCRRLSTSDWRCDPVSNPITPGLLFFYTRVKASSDTTIEHRWYREDRLRQSVELRIQASPGSGYRTYTRRTVSAENAGNWRVEVRAKDGSLLHEERFTVR